MIFLCVWVSRNIEPISRVSIGVVDNSPEQPPSVTDLVEDMEHRNQSSTNLSCCDATCFPQHPA